MCFVLLTAMLVAEFLIPGSNANVLLVFTVVHKRRSEEPLQKDVFLGQAVLTLQSIVALSINDKTCTLDLRDIEVSSPPSRCMAPRLAGLDVRCGCWLCLLHPLCPQYVPMETPYSEVKMDALANFQPTGKLRVREWSPYGEEGAG